MKNTNSKYFHCYATGNDSRFFRQDFKNLKRIKNTLSGVDEIYLFIAVSRVRRFNIFDMIFKKIVQRMFRNHPTIKLEEIVFKSNIGRDFSSYQKMFERVKTIATDEDFVFFQNRSGHGPFHENWYRAYIEQFEKFDSIAICGTTINFCDHPFISSKTDMAHVQTFAFLTKVSFLKLLGKDFPGANETDKLKIIANGEIVLSQIFLKNNYKITSIEWPDEPVAKDTIAFYNFDLKGSPMQKHYFYHRKYIKGIKRKRYKRENILDHIKFNIQGLSLLTPKIYADSRGYFMESFKQGEIEKELGKINFVQENESCSSFGVLRGLHFQTKPFAQSKLVRCVVGKIIDIAVDLRPNSKTFGQYKMVELSEENKKQFFLPQGFAHGFLTLSEKAIVQYKVDNYYSPEHDSGIFWNDKDLAINWEFEKYGIKEPIISEKDAKQQSLQEFKKSL